MHCVFFRIWWRRMFSRSEGSRPSPPHQYKNANSPNLDPSADLFSVLDADVSRVPETNISPKDPAITATATRGDESTNTACHPSPLSLEGLQPHHEPGLNFGTTNAALLRSVQTLPRADSRSSMCTLTRSGITISETGHPDREPPANGNRDSIDNNSDDNKSSEQTLRDDLCNARWEWPEGSFRYFIAVDDFRRIVTKESISLELARCGVELASDERRRKTAEEISKDAPKLFAILVCLKRGHQIIDFLDERINDKHLPFVRFGKTAKSGHFKLCSKWSPDQPIKCMAGWDQARINDFGRDQWSMFAPIFEYGEEIQHNELDDNCVLPIVQDEERGNQAIQGSYGSVWKIAIHPAHQQVYGSTDKQLASRFVALKRLHSTDEQDFKSEVDMLKMLKKRKHAHVINLLATFRLKGRYFLLFPYADFNLRQYWQHIPIPDFSQATVSWVLHQWKAIASALHEVHLYQSTHCSDTSKPEDEGRRYGRHGDIKAENILLFAEGGVDDRGLLVLADFGMTAFHKETSRSKVKPELVTGSPSYEPPELMLHLSISRAYDIWSLGCFFLEFISWLLCGWEQLSRFPDARGGTRATTPELHDDMFFTILEGEHKAIVRQGVQDWMKDLHEMPRCSSFLHEMLSLISERMLVVDAGDRIQISQLNIQLAQMIQRSTMDPFYLITPIPSSPRDQNPNSSSLAAFRKNGAFKPPLPTEGTPLPRRSSSVSGTQRTSVPLPQTEALMFIDTSPPTSPPTSPAPERATIATFE